MESREVEQDFFERLKNVKHCREELELANHQADEFVLQNIGPLMDRRLISWKIGPRARRNGFK